VRALLVPAVLLAVSLAVAAPAAALCETAEHVGYTTVCALDQGFVGEPGFGTTHNYLVHAAGAMYASAIVGGLPVHPFQYYGVNVGQESFEYLDPSGASYTGNSTDASFFFAQGVTGVVGMGAQGGANQLQEQATSCDDTGSCVQYLRSATTNAGGSAWVSFQDGPSVGLGLYYTQRGSGPACAEHGQAEVDVLGSVEVVPLVDGPCAYQPPNLYEEAPLPDWP
jgi:hypothetical protein